MTDPVGLLILAGILVLLAVVVIAKTAIVVPQQSAYVVERLGRYSNTLAAGFHILTPFVGTVKMSRLAPCTPCSPET